MKKATIWKLGLAGVMLALCVVVPATVMAVDPRNLEIDWTPQWYEARTSALSSTHNVTGTGFAWLIYADGGNIQYTLYTTTKTYAASLGLAPAVVASSTGYALNGKPIGGTYTALSMNPRIVLHGLTAGVTAYVKIEYGEARK